MLRLNKTYLLLTILLFLTEVCIALFVHDRIVRPYVGDFLVAILVYCFVRSFLRIPVFRTAIFTLLFCYAVETLQYFQIVEKLGLQSSSVARVAIGSSFEWTDIFLYTAGIIVVLIAEKLFNKKQA